MQIKIFNTFFSGYFEEYIDCDFAYIWHTTYVHQEFIRAQVTDIYALRKDPQYGGVIYLEYPEVDDTQDITFEPPQDYFGGR